MMSFGEAVKAMCVGDKVARQGWNGKGMFLFMVIGNHWGFQSDVSGIDGLETCSFVCMKTADNKLVPWLASQSDVLSYDWVILEDK